MNDPMRPGDAVKPRAICGAKTRSGDPCQSYPVEGATRCRMHGASAPAVRAKAKERVLRARMQADVAELGWEPVTNPALALAEIAGEMLAFKDLARQKMNELHSWENENVMGAEDVKARVTIYTQASRDAASVLDKMWGRGLDEGALREMLRIRAERPTREQAQAFARVLQAVDLTPEQQQQLVAAMTEEGLLP